MMIIHAQVGENLEYFIKVDNKKGLNYQSFKGFLVRRLDGAPDYLSRLILQGILAADMIAESEYGFPEIGEALHGASRCVFLRHKPYSIQFSVIHVQKLED